MRPLSSNLAHRYHLRRRAIIQVDRMKLFQSYIGEEQRAHISAAAIPLDASGNVSGDAREYELFKTIFSKKLAEDENASWGLVSWKFQHKSLVSVDAFRAYCEDKLNSGYDCVFINPMIGNEALYVHVWEQGAHVGHRGIDKIAAYINDALGISTTVPMGARCFAMCNYFAGNRRFWNAYFPFVDGVLRELEREAQMKTEIGGIYAGVASYANDPCAGMRPFITERLFSTFLNFNRTVKAVNYRHEAAHYEMKFGRLLGSCLYTLSGVKNEALSHGDTSLFQSWAKVRRQILAPPSAVGLLDDPPSYFLSSDYLEFKRRYERPIQAPAEAS